MAEPSDLAVVRGERNRYRAERDRYREALEEAERRLTEIYDLAGWGGAHEALRCHQQSLAPKDGNDG